MAPLLPPNENTPTPPASAGPSQSVDIISLSSDDSVLSGASIAKLRVDSRPSFEPQIIPANSRFIVIEKLDTYEGVGDAFLVEGEDSGIKKTVILQDLW